MAEVSLRERRQTLLEQPTLRGLAFCRAYAAAADGWLSEVADRASPGGSNRLALVAVGGYGRGELCPFSDLDVVLVHEGRGDVKQVADAIWYPVWDEGVHLDHSVRRPAEVLEAAAGDLRVALGLLDGRRVWGEPKVAEPLLAKARELWGSRLGATWLPALAQQMEERRRRYGDLAFLLEPDLKDSHGGLRDVNVLQAVAAYAPLLADYVDLESLAPAAELLTEVRVELHRGAGREQDRLLLQDQDHIAGVLGYPDADALMAAVAEAGRAIAWVSEDAWRRQRLWQPESRRPRGRRGRRTADGGGGVAGGVAGGGAGGGAAAATEGEVEPGVAVVAGEVALTPAAAVAGDPSLPLRLAAVAAERNLPIARGALHRLADKMPAPPDPWPPEARQALVRVLLAGRPAVDALEALDHEGLWVRLLPEWAGVRNKPQRNAYHRFTVDRHLLEAAANAAALADRVERPDLLVLGALLHDIGKGYPGDHIEVGMDLVRTMAGRMGFAPADVDTLVSLVRLHLLVPDTATRRDLDDPTTIETVAETVGDLTTIRLLGALTEADSLATGPSAWGSWKAGLVADLVDRVSGYFDGGTAAAAAGGGWVREVHRNLMEEVRATGRPAVLLEPPEVVVAAPDRPGLLAAVAGVLALHGLDVRSADVTSDDGVAAEVFTVEVPRGAWPDSARLREDLEAVLSDRLALTDRLEAKARAYADGKRPSAARPVVPRVWVDNEASATSTVVEVRAANEVGLLNRVTRALFDCGLDVVSARVSTLGEAVVDAFYVRDESGGKVTDRRTLGIVAQRLNDAIG
ncbi:MAG TPA: [protein-PII] uridylyltransferase [Acidimicrobiales bacterium]|nr:[protein-PII] uridylyltransferase [Acidimicrobiales bacterium]